MNGAIQSLTGSRRFIGLFLLGVVVVFYDKIGIDKDQLNWLGGIVLAWVGAETARSSKDGSGILGGLSKFLPQIMELLKQILENKDKPNVPPAA